MLPRGVMHSPPRAFPALATRRWGPAAWAALSTNAACYRTNISKMGSPQLVIHITLLLHTYALTPAQLSHNLLVWSGILYGRGIRACTIDVYMWLESPLAPGWSSRQVLRVTDPLGCSSPHACLVPGSHCFKPCDDIDRVSDLRISA